MMTIRVHNTLTGRKEEFVPAEDRRVRIYVCGVTPYAETHIGHARPSVFWDVVRRYLEYRGYDVLLVQNFTDVDDKVIAKARATGRDPLELSRAYSEEYLQAMDRLGVRRADVYPRVSDHIDDIIEVIVGLVERGSAYVCDGDVFFDVSTFPDYGKLSSRTVAELKAGARVEVDERKRSPVDFALWKSAKPGEPSWPSPWGPGRPGWHIECTAMALKYLGSGFDLHGGGTELVFPHHENEIAQAEAYTGEAPFCRYWLHHEMINVRGEKMSKSLGNFVPADEVLDRAPAGAVRLLLLSAHYRKPLDFDWDILEENVRAWRRLNDAAAGLRGALAARGRPTAGAGQAVRAEADEPASALDAAAADAVRRFEAAMDDDLNTAGALAALFDLARSSNRALARGPDAEPVEALERALSAMTRLGTGVLGVVEEEGPVPRGEAADAGPLLDLLLEVRRRLRADRRFELADFVRDSLANLGYEVQDTPEGTVVRRRR